MADKFTRMSRTLPSFYKAETNVMIRGLLKSWGIEDDQIVTQIANAKKSIFVATAEGRYLDFLGSNVGVPRTPELSIDDDDYRKLIPVMSFKPKQVRQTIIDLLDVFWGPTFTRANINSGNIEPFNFGPASLLTGTVNFIKDKNVVRGTGTLFLTEVAPGDYIKPSAATGTQYAKVSKVISDTALELSMVWSSPISLNTAVAKGVTRELKYIVDERTTKVLRFIPNAFADLTAVTVDELATFINNHPEHRDLINAESFLDPILGVQLNIRTTTPGIQGSIQILGGDANDPSRLNFSLEMAREIRAGVFEINPNEIVVLIPSSVPILRRTLKGAVHPKETKTAIFSLAEPYDFTTLGPTSTLNITIDGTPYVVNFTNATDFEDPSKATSEEVADVINAQLTFLHADTGFDPAPRKIRLRTTEGSSEYQVTGGTANAILGFSTALQQDPDLLITGYPSSYVFNPLGQSYTVTQIASELSAQVVEGTLSATLSLADASSFPNTPGKFLINFGKSNQEGPIDYNSRPNNNTLLIDASHIFQFTHPVGSPVNFVADQPTIPRVTGIDYPVYIVGTEEAREATQLLIKKLLAAGVVVRFIVSFPEVLFECLCRDCGASTSPDYRGELTGSGPLVF